MRRAFVILLSLPLLINVNGGIAGIKFAEQKTKQPLQVPLLRTPSGPPKCEYVPADRTYSCQNIVDKFPNIFYGNYHLKCTDCALTTFRKETFPHNNDLISMNLTDSNVRTIAKEAFTSLTTLQYIYLQHNHLKNIDENAFVGLRQMFELHLEHNELKELKHGFLSGFEANSVFICDNLLEEIPANVFEGIYGVMTLDLSRNKIHKLHRDSFDHLKGLEYLDLQGNKLCQLPMGMFKQMRLLKDLNLSYNNFKTFQVGTFSGLPNLYALNFSHNALVGGLDLTLLIPLENLSLLDIVDTNIDFIDPMEVHFNAPQLKHIALAENRWNCRILNNLLQHLRTKQINIVEYNNYEVTNVKGIACADQSITDEPIPFSVFYKYVKAQTEKDRNQNQC